MIKYTIVVFVFFLLVIVLNVVPDVASQRAGKPGEWSTRTSSLLHNPDSESVSVSAPDKRTAVMIAGINIRVIQNGKALPGTENEAVLPLAELAWSADSRAFFITWSEGGSVGQWLTNVYLIEKERVRRLDVVKNVEREFKKHYKCDDPEEPNIAGLEWLDGFRGILLIAEVPPHSSCPEMGKIMGYRVAVPSGKILEQLSETAVRAKWGQYFGIRLK